MTALEFKTNIDSKFYQQVVNNGRFIILMRLASLKGDFFVIQYGEIGKGITKSPSKVKNINTCIKKCIKYLDLK